MGFIVALPSFGIDVSLPALTATGASQHVAPALRCRGWRLALCCEQAHSQGRSLAASRCCYLIYGQLVGILYSAIPDSARRMPPCVTGIAWIRKVRGDRGARMLRCAEGPSNIIAADADAHQCAKLQPASARSWIKWSATPPNQATTVSQIRLNSANAFTRRWSLQ
jgi:hypothetical protein